MHYFLQILFLKWYNLTTGFETFSASRDLLCSLFTVLLLKNVYPSGFFFFFFFKQNILFKFGYPAICIQWKWCLQCIRGVLLYYLVTITFVWMWYSTLFRYIFEGWKSMTMPVGSVEFPSNHCCLVLLLIFFFFLN